MQIFGKLGGWVDNDTAIVLNQDSMLNVRSLLEICNRWRERKEFNGTGIKSNFRARIALRSIGSFEWGKHCSRQWNELKPQLWEDKPKLMVSKIYNIEQVLLG